MKRFLLFAMMCVCASIGAWAAEFTWTDGTYTVTASNVNLNGDVFQKLEVSGPGALAAFVAATKDLSDSDGGPLKGVGGNSTRVNLRIEGELNAADFSSMNSTDVPCWGTFTSLKMDNATVADFSALSGMSMSGLKYLQLPGSLANVDDMKTLKGKNSNLDIVIALTTEESEAGNSLKKAVIQSFTANSVPGAYSALRDGDGFNGFTALRDAKVITMSGEYGDKDLKDDTYNGGLYNNSPAVWDFTGAHFADCTVNGNLSTPYYNYDNPFQDPAKGSTSTAGDNYSTNAFWYFNAAGYPGSVVSIKLPDTNMTSLPPRSLYKLAYENKANYILLYGEDAFNANQATDETGKKADCVSIETLEIPSCYALLDYECAAESWVTSLYVGNGMKAIQGGAFSQSFTLENIDFEAGLSDCYLGESAFSNCQKMKHIALNEGVVSIGANCFHLNKHLESIRLPQSLLYIGNGGMDDCQALNSITIPENVKQIGQKAFVGCPFTDIYLTTTDPEKLPMVWSCGTKFTAFDGNCTFNHGHLDGWEGGVDAYENDIDGKMTWDEAAPFYYMNWNGMPVLHFPSQLAEKVRSQISSTYAMKSADDPAYGLPLRVDMDKRDNIPGADLGASGAGKYTKDGWAQFMLMKEYVTTGPNPEVYQKEYDDVWYTMCFPFDLTDEQLAAAFNETFNIVDFSGVEVKEADENNGKMKLILHFKNVAVTDYKDTDDKHYTRKTDANGIIREKDATSGFSYNVYLDENNQEYHHVTTSSMLASNKTKTFAPGNSMSAAQAAFNANHEVAVMIDGVLATAGHPYLIHPAIGVVAGQPKQRCNFSGIEWKGMTTWDNLFKKNSRTIDLGVKKTLTELPDSNYNHPGYPGYEGQKYTFIGNAKEYRDEAQTAIDDEPQVPEEPTEPVAPTVPDITLAEFEAQNKPTKVDDPGITWGTMEETVYSLLKDGKNQYERGPWENETSITASYNDGSSQWNSWSSKKHFFDGIEGVYNPHTETENCFNQCKSIFNNKSAVAAYQQYLTDLAIYNNNYDALEAAWDRYNAWQADNGESEWEHYRSLKQAYENAVAAHDAWVENAEKWKTFIPKNAYFLGRKTGQLPKFYREIADDPAEGEPSTRTGGVWTQFTAIVIPNDAALNGIEKGISAKAAQSKGFDMLFNEDFEGTFEEDDPGIVTAIEEARKAGADVKYMDIVVSINGQVVRRGSTSIEGLPKGMYIINGKKYFVK